VREIGHVVRATTPTHARLRSRVAVIATLTLIFDAVATVAMFMFERHAGGSDIHNMFDSFYWTSAQLSTVSSQMSNPLTAGGRLLGLAIDFYSITVVATLAGLFGAFFHKRGMEHAHEAAKRASGDPG
jgi:hypothetical protein